MKKVFGIFVIAMAIGFAQSLSAQSANYYANCPFSVSVCHDAEFMKTYHKVLELNAGRFSNLDKIQIGDTVLFPSLTGGVNQFLVADAPVNGVHDCLYRMTDKYICGQLKTTPLPVVNEVIPIPVKVQDASVSTPNVFWKSLIGIIILVILLYLVLYYGYIKKHDINANPVIVGGLSDDAAHAKSQIDALIPNFGTKKVERGQLIGVTPAKVEMNFADKSRKVKLISGEEYFRITGARNEVLYARKRCGNLTDGVISGVGLPFGWTFVPSTEENSTWVAPKTEEKPVVEAKGDSKPETEAVKSEIKNDELFRDSILNGTDIALILDAAGKMSNFPSSISVGDLTVCFYKNNENNENNEKAE